MFHQSVSQKDRDALRFVRRENSNEVFSDYKRKVPLFGKNNFPSIANFDLKKADKKGIIHPSVVTSIDQDVYMNNFLKWDNSVEHLTRIIKTDISVITWKRNTKQDIYSRTKWSRANS